MSERGECDALTRSVLRGESLVVTRTGRPVAAVIPLHRPLVDAVTLLERWRGLPHIDPARLRSDVDAPIDPRL
jgi:antitoxin (DNA-binding transcriptional repressor) of toxin-antitoxin stability system